MISRRAILRGAGATIGLPSLPSLSARGDGAPPPPARLLAFFVPCGFWMDSWAPRGLGETWELSPTLAALAPHKQKTLVISGLDNLPAREPEGTGDHACGTAGFLTCRGAKKLPSGAFSLGVSMDQVAARVLGRRTRVRSLQLGVKDVVEHARARGAGPGGGRLGLRGGRHLRYQKRPIADLFLALLHAVGAPVATFGEDGTAPLPNLG
jgi:hypothetical protein